MGFCCCEADEFGAGEGKCGCYEDVAEAFEAVVECSLGGISMCIQIILDLGKGRTGFDQYFPPI